MIMNKSVNIRICPANITYWKNLGYNNVLLNVTSEVKPKDLPPNSNVVLDCTCERCGMKYKQRISRNTSICGKCLSSERMKNNTLGKKNGFSNIIDSKLLESYITAKKTKSNIAKKHKVSISVVNRWLRQNKIEIEPYYGRKYFKTKKEEENAITKCNDYLKNNSTANMAEVSRHTNIPKHIISIFRKKKKININTQFDLWKETYGDIIQNLDFYVSENRKKSLKQISQEYNISIEQLKKAFSTNNIPIKLHSYNKSRGELNLKEFILNFNVDCFSVNLNKTYEIDCYVPSLKFGIEYCGEYWHRYQPSKNNKYYHKNKYLLCEKNGIELMTIFAHEWEIKRPLLESMIKSRLGLNEKIFARKCVIKEVTSDVSNNFHRQNHMSENINSPINIGLYMKDELVSVLSLIKSRFDKTYEYEIGRFSSKKNINVIGGLSKLFTYFVRTYKPKSVMTYADLRFGSGKAYSKIGFKYAGMTVPNYFYFKKNGDELETRLRYQKEKLKKFSNYDSTKTEFQIMTENDYYRLYDCGNKKYVWKKN